MSMSYQPPSKWTPSLAIRLTIYLTIGVPLLVAVPEVRHGIGYLLMQVGTVASYGVGIFLGLLILTGAKPPRR
jgi:hypothetical protein